MKLTPAAALATACGVSLEWLATGVEPPPATPIQSSSAPEPAEGAERSAESRLFNIINIDKFSEALDTVLDRFTTQKGRRETHKIVQAAVLIYDLMQEPDDETVAPTDDVATSPERQDR